MKSCYRTVRENVMEQALDGPSSQVAEGSHLQHQPGCERSEPVRGRWVVGDTGLAGSGWIVRAPQG